MADAPALFAALQSLKTATDVVKALRGAEVGFEKAELKIQVAQLAEALVEARTSVLDAQEEIDSLKARIRELEATQDIRSKIVHRDSVFFLREGEEEKGPYCPRCFEVNKQVMPLSNLSHTFREFGTYKCPNCKACY